MPARVVERVGVGITQHAYRWGEVGDGRRQAGSSGAVANACCCEDM